MGQKLKLVKGADLWQEPQQSTYTLPMTAPGNSPGAMSQFGSRKLHFALTQKGVGKSRGWNLFLTRVPGLPNLHPSHC